MALPQPVTVSQQANMIQAWMQQWAEPLGGVAVVVSNLRELWEQSSLNSQTPRILICFMGEQSRGSFEQKNAWHRVDRMWTVAATKGRGYASNRGDTLSNPNQTALPFYDAIEQVRDRLRQMLGISEELPTIDYLGMKQMQLGNLVVDGVLIEFSTANDLCFIGSTPDPATPQN